MGGRGRGGGGGGAANTVRSVANALGIARHDMQRMMSAQKIDPPPLYPKVQRDPIPLEMTTDMIYVSRLKMELDQRLRDSQYFLEAQKEKEIKRYLDKYSVITREKLSLDMTCLPNELNWKRTGKGVKKPDAKKRKLDNTNDAAITEKLKKLEEREKGENEDEDEEKPANEDESGSEKSAAEENDQALSDDDYQEEDNDYISNYFDNGENYGDGGSDDNMDGDEY